MLWPVRVAPARLSAGRVLQPRHAGLPVETRGEANVGAPAQTARTNRRRSLLSPRTPSGVCYGRAAQAIVSVCGVLHGRLGGLTWLSSQPILHRDIKPDNILLRADWTPALADFGLSKQLLRRSARDGHGNGVGEARGYRAATRGATAPESSGGSSQEDSLGLFFTSERDSSGDEGSFPRDCAKHTSEQTDNTAPHHRQTAIPGQSFCLQALQTECVCGNPNKVTMCCAGASASKLLDSRLESKVATDRASLSRDGGVRGHSFGLRGHAAICLC
jgi:serine/threonine protein kinase